MKILVFAEQRNGKLKGASLETLSLAYKLSGNQPAQVAAVLIGSQVDGLAKELAGWGCDKVFLANAAEYKDYNVFSYTDAVDSALKSFGADVLLAPATPMGKDLLPRLAVRHEAALMTDVIALKQDGDGLTASKPMYAGKVLAELKTSGSGLKIASIRPNVFGQNKANQGSATIEAISGAAKLNPALVTKEIRKGNSEKPDLTEAAIIISGGRSLASAENFRILNDCADVIGATVGASRAAVDSGYASHDMQVGQTGKTVNPNLYIACGISGSIQHLAGMRTSKIIVAVNTDPDAPIFSIADYGIVADLFEAVPIMTEKFKALL